MSTDGFGEWRRLWSAWREDIVYAAAFSADGTRVITASADATARAWDAVTGQPVTPPLEHQAVVHAAGGSPDGTRVVTASWALAAALRMTR